MTSGRGPRTPSGFHALFSTGVGVFVPGLAHHHQLIQLVALVVVWLGINAFMHIRARHARGVFIDEEVEFFSWLGTGGFLTGLVFALTYYVIFAN
jgi:hypothetical protein